MTGSDIVTVLERLIMVHGAPGRLRDELLAVEGFHTLLEAKMMAEDYRQQHNRYPLNSSLGYPTPDPLLLQWSTINPGLTKSLAH